MAQKAKDKERDLAAFLYCEKGLTLTEISERLDLPMKTLSKWKTTPRKGELEWDERKRLNLSAIHTMKETITIEMEKILKGEKSLIDADQLVKLASSLEKISKKINPQIIISVVMKLENFMALDDPQEAVRSLPYHKRFIQHVIKENG